MSPVFASTPAPVDSSADAAEAATPPGGAAGAKADGSDPTATGTPASEDVRAATGSQDAIPLLARLEQQREDRRAWAAAVQAAERAAAMAASLVRGVPADDRRAERPFEMMQATEGQRQLDVALRIVRMPDTAGLRFELRL